MKNPAIVEGPPGIPLDELPPDLASGIAARLTGLSDGRLWQYDLEGKHRSSDYQSLWDFAGLLAGELQSLGATRDTPIVLLLDDVLHFVPGFWACLRAGCPAVPLNSLGLASLRGKSLEPLLPTIHALHPLAVICDHKFTAVCDQLQEMGVATLDAGALEHTEHTEHKPLVPVTRNPEDLVCIMPSSGTTGSPKLVALSERAMLTRVFAGSSGLRNGGDATALDWFSLDSITGLGCMSLQYGQFIRVPTQIAMTQPLAVLDGIEHFRGSYVHLNSYLADRIITAADAVDRSWNLESLQRIGFGSEAIVPAVVRRSYELLKRHGASNLTVVAGYGMSEVGLIAMGELSIDQEFVPPSESTTTLGSPVRGVSVRIVDEGGNVLPEPEVGHVQIRAPEKLFSGYVGRPDMTGACFTQDGWFRSGDLGSLTDGRLRLTGRAGETFIFGGKNHGLADIECLLSSLLGSDVGSLSAVVVRTPDDVTDSLAVFFEPVPRAPARIGSLILAMRRAIHERIGVPVRHWVPLWPGQIPRTTIGKVQRARLAEQLCLGELRTLVVDLGDDAHPPQKLRGGDLFLRAGVVWQRVLHLDHLPDPDDDFFDHGGHSLASAELVATLERELGAKIPVGDFFARPTFGRLVALVSRNLPAAAPTIEKLPPWPFPNDLYHRLHSFVAAWDGERRTFGSLVSVLNAGGTKMPLAWVFQSTKEFSRLAQSLGEEQPVYGMRSGSQIMDYGEGNVQALALAYAQELQEMCPGPIAVGGNCQGGIIALAVAQHLLRRRRHVPLLVLMEWSFVPVSYPEQVLLLFGRESQAANPLLRYRRPEMGWRRAFPRHSAEYISGEHGHFFDPKNISSLCGALTRHLASATHHEPLLKPACAYHANISVDTSLTHFEYGRRVSLYVTVRNTGCLPWREFECSGLMLAARWLRPGGQVVDWRDGGAQLPALEVGGEVRVKLHVQPPCGSPTLRLMVDVVEEGCTWFHRMSSPPFEREVTIAEPSPRSMQGKIWRILLRLFTHVRRLSRKLKKKIIRF